MNKYFLILCTVCLIWIFSCKTNTLKNSLPVIRLDKDSIYIGNIQKGDSVDLDVKITNIGFDTLKIIDIGVDCGCTNVSVSNKFVAKDDSSFLHITYNSMKSNDEGLFRKSIVIRNNSEDIFKILRISGNIIK
jgi:hypothetical protein